MGVMETVFEIVVVIRESITSAGWLPFDPPDTVYRALPLAGEEDRRMSILQTL
jgi:hypothetical protein